MLEILSQNKQELDNFINELAKLKGIFSIEVLMKEEKIYHNIS
jgi:hypothetical protein